MPAIHYYSGTTSTAVWPRVARRQFRSSNQERENERDGSDRRKPCKTLGTYLYGDTPACSLPHAAHRNCKSIGMQLYVRT